MVRQSYKKYHGYPIFTLLSFIGSFISLAGLSFFLGSVWSVGITFETLIMIGVFIAGLVWRLLVEIAYQKFIRWKHNKLYEKAKRDMENNKQ